MAEPAPRPRSAAATDLLDDCRGALAAADALLAAARAKVAAAVKWRDLSPEISLI